MLDATTLLLSVVTFSIDRYVPREWLLARAYTAAEAGDCQPLNEAMQVFGSPFDKHPDSVVCERFSRLTPSEMLSKAGIAYFS